MKTKANTSLRQRDRAGKRKKRIQNKARGGNIRIRWSGRNVDEMTTFVTDNGGVLEVVEMRLPTGMIRLIPYVMPAGVVIHRGRWLERVVEHPASEKRGWKTFM